MKNTENTKNWGHIGAWAGVAGFLAYGLMHGALVGGTAGLQASLYIAGGTAAADMVSRVMTAAGMLAGAGFAAFAFVVTGFALGRMAGSLANAEAYVMHSHGATGK